MNPAPKEKLLFLLNFLPAIMVGLALILVFALLIMQNNQTKERQLIDQTYGRFNSCSLSFPPGTRSQSDIDYCWKQAQQDTDIKVKVYNGQGDRQ